MYSSIYLYRFMDRYIHTYPYIYMRCITHKCIYISFSCPRSPSRSRSRSRPPSSSFAFSRSRSVGYCSLTLLLSRSLLHSISFFLSLSLSLSPFTYTHTCFSHTSCLFRCLPFHSLSLTLGLNQLMIPKQGEYTCDTSCFGLGGGVTRVMQGEYTCITILF